QKISAVHHPNICTLYAAATEGGTPYLVVEYLEGETLAERLTRGALPLDEVMRIAVQIAQALDFAHQKGVVHHDLKPSNIMLVSGENGVEAKLLDLGLALVSGAAQAAAAASSLTARGAIPQSLTVESSVKNAFQYMPPELLGGSEGDARSDIFS